MTNQVCALCSKPVVEGGEFCAFCGAKVIPSGTTSTIDTYIQNKVKLELSDRLKDQNSLVREIGDKAEEIVWKRFNRYSVIFGALLACILGFIAFVGIKSINDVSTSAKNKIEPVVKEAEQRAQAARETVNKTAETANSVKGAVDQLSRDVNAQTKRVADKGGEISKKLETLDAAATNAQKTVSEFWLHRCPTYRANSHSDIVILHLLQTIAKAHFQKPRKVGRDEHWQISSARDR